MSFSSLTWNVMDRLHNLLSTTVPWMTVHANRNIDKTQFQSIESVYHKQQSPCTVVQKQGNEKRSFPCPNFHCCMHKSMPSSTMKTTNLEPDNIWQQLEDGPRLGDRPLDKIGSRDSSISIHCLIFIILLGLLVNNPANLQEEVQEGGATRHPAPQSWPWFR